MANKKIAKKRAAKVTVKNKIARKQKQFCGFCSSVLFSIKKNFSDSFSAFYSKIRKQVLCGIKIAEKRISVFVKRSRIFYKSLHSHHKKASFGILSSIIFLSLAIGIYLGIGYFYKQALVINNTHTVALEQIVAGQPVKLVTLVDANQIKNGRRLVEIPKNATGISVQKVTPMEVRDMLAGNYKLQHSADAAKEAAHSVSINEKASLAAVLQNPSFLAADLSDAGDSIAQTIISSTDNTQLVDVSGAATDSQPAPTPTQPDATQPSVVQPAQPDTTQTPTTPADITPTLPTSTSSTSITDTTSPSTDSTTPTQPTTPDQTQTQDNSTQQPCQGSATDNCIAVQYTTPAPTIQTTDTSSGQQVTVSAQDETTPLTDVLAFTTIPHIFKVGQESKIQIKWKNNGNQNVTFHAYDKDNDGYLDYVEWTVPHLSTQIFDIIFISKAFQLDSNQNILADIYPQTVAQDNNWANLTDGQYVRATFEQVLDNTKDNTIYARPTNSTSPATVEVYPVYTDSNGNSVDGPLVATFPSIDHEGIYKILLTNLQTPTDTFDLKITGNVDIDWIMDAACNSTGSGNWSNSGIWSCGHVPTSADDVTIGNVVTMDQNGDARSMNLNGTLTFPASPAYNINLYYAGGPSNNTWNGNGTLNRGGGKLTFIGDGSASDVTIGGTTQTFNDITINNPTGTAAACQGCDLKVAGTLTISAGSNFRNNQNGTNNTINTAGAQGTITGAGTLILYNTFANSAKFSTYNMSGLTVNFNQANIDASSSVGTYGGLISSGGNSANENLQGNITVAGSVTLASGNQTLQTNGFDITLGGNWINNGGGFNQGSRTVTFNGTGASTVGGTNATTFYNLTVNKSSGSAQIASNTTISNNATVSGGTLAGPGGTIAGTVNVNSGGTIEPSLSGANGSTLSLSNAAGPTFALGSTFEVRAPSSTPANEDKISLTNGSAVFTATNAALYIDTTGLVGTVTGATIVTTAKGNGGVSGTFSSVTANNGYSVTTHYNTLVGTITVDLAVSAPPTGTSAVVQNSTSTTVDVVVTGTGFTSFVSSGTTTANATDRANITYRATNPTTAIINNATTMTLTFPIAIGTDMSGSLTLAAGTVQNGATPNLLITIVAGSITDSAKPVLNAIVKSLTGNKNRLTFTYSEPVTVTNGASSAASGDITTAGTVAGFGGFATTGNVTVPTTKNTVAGNGTATITIDLAAQSGGFLNSSSSTEPSGVFTPVASAAVVDAASNQVLTTATPTVTGGGTWDLTKPTQTPVTPATNAYINNTTTTVSITNSETIGSGTITATRTGGTADGSHTCTLVGTGLTSGAHTINFADTTNGCAVAQTLVNGAIYTFAFDATDLAGNLATTVSNTGITFDTTPPTLSPVSIVSNNVNTSYAKTGDQVTLSFTSSETIQTNPTVVFKSGGNAVAGAVTYNNPSGNNWTAKYTTQAGDTDGAVTFTINFTDLAGNAGTAVTAVTDSSSVTFDKTNPTAGSVTAPAADTYQTATSYNWQWGAGSDSGSGLHATTPYDLKTYTDSACTLGGVDRGTTTSTNMTVSGLANGTSYWAQVTYEDKAGNTSNSACSAHLVMSDTTNPTAGSVTAPAADTYQSSTSYNWQWGAGSDAGSGLDAVAPYDLHTYTNSSCSAGGSDRGSTTLTNMTVSGLSDTVSYWAQVVYKDKAGNTSTSACSTYKVLIDTDAPTAGSVTAPAADTYQSSTSYNWQWGAGSDAGSGLDAVAPYDLHTYTNSSCSAGGSDRGSTTLTNMTVPGLTTGTAYWAQVVYKDKAGNTSTSACSTYKVMINTAPTFTSISALLPPFFVGDTITFNTVASDPDAGDTINVYVCKSADFNGSTCGAGGEWCDSSLNAPVATNPSCTYSLVYTDAVGSHNYFAYLVDNHGLQATNNSINQSFTVTNTLPIASGVSINSGAGSVTPIEGTTQNVTCSATVSDDNGYSDLTNVTAKFYRSGVGAGASDDNSNHYTLSGLGNCSGSGTSGTCTFTFAVEYYADPTDSGTYAAQNWNCQVTPTDHAGDGTPATSIAGGIEMNTLKAFSVAATIDYGSVQPGQSSVTPATAAVANTGNITAQINVAGNEANLSCNASATGIPVGDEQYNTSTFSYGSGTALTTSPNSIIASLAKSTNPTDPTPVPVTTYWQIAVPYGVQGTCSGTISFTAS